MSDIDKTARVGVVTPVNPSRPLKQREVPPGQRRDRRSGPGNKPRPEPEGDHHKVDDYA